MLERFLLLADFITRVLLKLNGDELESLSEVRDLLKPLWQVTVELSSENSDTLQMHPLGQCHESSKYRYCDKALVTLQSSRFSSTLFVTCSRKRWYS